MSTSVAKLKTQTNRIDMKQFMAYFVTILAIVSNLVVVGWGQQHSSSGGSTSCINQLAPCLNYLYGNDVDVPDSCCDPLKDLIKSKPECLCSMISNKGSRQAEQAGINVTLAQQLPGRCGQHVNPLGCLRGSRDTETSAQDSAFILFQSHSSIFAVTICMVVQILLFIMI